MNLVEFFKNSKNVQTFSNEEVIFEQGATGDTSYILIEGKADIRVNGQSVYIAEPGEVLGILALLDEDPRSATVVALGPCRLATLNREEFLFLVQETPYFAIDMMKLLAKWVRQMDMRV